MAANINHPVFASVLGMALRDFTRQPIADQARWKAGLEAAVEAAIRPLAVSERVVLDTPHGSAIVVLGSPEEALGLAERAQTLAPRDLPLGIGLNHGPVIVSRDSEPRRELHGDGIAAAMTLANAAEPGRFLASRSFQEALAASGSDRAAELGAAGVHTDASVRTHELFAFDPRAAGTHRRRLLITGSVAVIGIIGAGVIARTVRLGARRPAVIHLQIRPRGEIVVDGVVKGRSPPLTQLEVSAGAHTIEVRNSGFPPLKLDVNLKPDEKITIAHSFGSPAGKESLIERWRRKLGPQ